MFNSSLRLRLYAAISLWRSFPVVVIATGAIALIDPFGSGEPWLIWVSLLLGGVLGLFFSLILAVAQYSEDEANPPRYRFNMIFGGLTQIGIVGGILTAVVSIFAPAIAWSVYVTMLMAFALNSWFMSRAHKMIESAKKRVS